MRMVSVTFAVNAVTTGDETVCLVGSHPRLGSWNPENSIQLNKSEPNRWSCCVTLDANTSYSYRYFVCKRLPNDASAGTGSDTILDVVRWETHWQPRHIEIEQEESFSLPEEKFGNIGGIQSESVGWLMNHVFEVHVRLHGGSIKLLKRDANIRKPFGFMVRCVPVDYAGCQSTQDNSPLTHADVLVSNLSCKDSHPHPQDPQGVCLGQQDFIVFRHRTSCLSSLGCLLEISACGDDGKVVAAIGSAHLVPENLPESQHVLHLPIVDTNAKCSGSIKADIFVVRPIPDMTFDMKSCDQSYSHWRDQSRVSLDGGHRGMGASFSVANPYKENTVASFDAAYKCGANFIETDILVTKDLVPVIYHDFNASIAMEKTSNSETSCDHHVIPIHDMTLKEIQCNKFFSHGKEITDEIPSPDKRSSVFPTLANILTDVNPSLGFDLELKYPQKEITGIMEAEAKLDMNTYVDTILKVIYQHAKDRQIFFSTFQPEICTLLKLKQSRYPVVFLTQGESKMYTSFLDFRCATYPHSINFAVSEGILGLVMHAELLLDDLPMIEDVIARRLALFVWGLHNNDPKVIEQMRKWKVDGVIYDRIDLHRPENAKKRLESGSTNGNNSNNTSPRHRKLAPCGEVEGSPQKTPRY